MHLLKQIEWQKYLKKKRNRWENILICIDLPDKSLKEEVTEFNALWLFELEAVACGEEVCCGVIVLFRFWIESDIRWLSFKLSTDLRGKKAGPSSSISILSNCSLSSLFPVSCVSVNRLPFLSEEDDLDSKGWKVSEYRMDKVAIMI